MIKTVDVSYGGEIGFNQAIELSAETLGSVKLVQEKRLLQKYFDEISQDTGKYCFMVEDTLRALELGAVEKLLGDYTSNVIMSSTKSSIGHLLGAAGAVEAIFCILSIRDQIAPPTINLDIIDKETKIDLAPNKSVNRKINYALSNSFGFGGTNASLIFKKI